MSYLKKKAPQKVRTTSGPKRLGPGFLLWSIWGWAIFITGMVVAGYVGYILLDLPEVSSINSYRPKQVTEVLDRDGNPLAYWYKERRWVVPLSVMPEYLKDAFLAAEDARFYEHPGIDFLGIIRAMIKNIEAGTIIQGASTITQQVTRALLLSPERSWKRKLKEAILAWRIDHLLTKDEILEIYLNQIYLGEGAYGVEAAARTYFDKNVWDLTLEEAAILAGLTQAPSKYNPRRHLERAKRRQAYVLRRMAEEGFITEEEAKRALNAPIVIKSYSLTPPPGAAYFLEEVRKDLLRRYGPDALYTKGLIIKTTLDSRLQEKAYKEVKQGIEAIQARHPGDEALKKNIRAALFAMDATTGEVLAVVGGMDYKENKFNLATQALIQPGSSFKPIVYSTAMERGLILPNTLLVDEPISLPGQEPGIPWRPQNFDKTYMGPITVRTALEYSRNVIAVKIARMVGVDAIRDVARRMGITTPIPNNLSIALGSQGVRLMELVRAYSTFPNLGESVRPQWIKEIEDKDGNIIEREQVERVRALSKVTAYEMLHLLEGVVQHGTGRRARVLGVPVGGKTGTTDNYRDALFLGFTKHVVCGVWIGRDDRLSLGRLETGGRAACPVWTGFMKNTLVGNNKEDMEFEVPKGVLIVPVDRKTGEIIGRAADLAKKEVVWEALPEEVVPEPKVHQWHIGVPGWLKKIGGFVPHF